MSDTIKCLRRKKDIHYRPGVLICDTCRPEVKWNVERRLRREQNGK